MELIKNKRKQFIAVVSLIFFFGLVLFVDEAFLTEESGNVMVESKAGNGEGYIEVDARIIMVDLINEHIKMRLDFTPYGKYADKGGLPVSDFDFHVSGISSEILHFEKGLRMFPEEITIDMMEGEVENYPFDFHKTKIEMLVVDTEKTKEGGKIESVPIDLKLRTAHHGYKITSDPIPEGSHGYVGYSILIKRSRLVLGTCIFLMIIMWGLTLVNLSLLWEVFNRRLEADVKLFAYLSSFIVAMYFFRQIFPDIPPFVGVFSDYLAFFWIEFVASTCTILLAIIWIINLKKKAPGKSVENKSQESF